MSAWRLIESGPCPGAEQMALDEALHFCCERGDAPTLRLFAFEPRALTLGRFQAARRDIDPAACEGHSVEVVRRPTGGRAVLHTADLCYAVIAPTDDPEIGGSINDSYCRLSEALTRALATVGAPAECLAAPAGPDYGAPAACFALTAAHEPQLGASKLVGSAQVRSQTAFLQQGSVRLAADSDLEAKLLGLSISMPALSDLLGRAISYKEMAAAMRDAFRECFAIALEPAEPTARERELADRLAREKYTDAAWTWQR
ncbi:MAG TPA: biotin/lipoate A/B protein ligase family protein [Dehalococcoidia bacterium]|nr:biotin/lipoate A/B protein ligase family protein [Dehalococcoidia bacterium]